MKDKDGQHLMTPGISKMENPANEREDISNNIMEENFPEVNKEWDLQVERKHWIPGNFDFEYDIKVFSS